MKITYYPDEQTVSQAIEHDIPLLILIETTGEEVIICDVDNGFEYHIVLRKLNYKEDLDKYFRIVVDREGADWTFVCPPDYRGISDKQKRIASFYNDGISLIMKVLAQIGYREVEINIPRRYARHLEILSNNGRYLD